MRKSCLKLHVYHKGTVAWKSLYDREVTDINKSDYSDKGLQQCFHHPFTMSKLQIYFITVTLKLITIMVSFS